MKNHDTHFFLFLEALCTMLYDGFTLMVHDILIGFVNLLKKIK